MHEHKSFSTWSLDLSNHHPPYSVSNIHLPPRHTTSLSCLSSNTAISHLRRHADILLHNKSGVSVQILIAYTHTRETKTWSRRQRILFSSTSFMLCVLYSCFNTTSLLNTPLDPLLAREFLLQLVDLLVTAQWYARSGPSHGRSTGHILSG